MTRLTWASLHDSAAPRARPIEQAVPPWPAGKGQGAAEAPGDFVGGQRFDKVAAQGGQGARALTRDHSTAFDTVVIANASMHRSSR